MRKRSINILRLGGTILYLPIYYLVGKSLYYLSKLIVLISYLVQLDKRSIKNELSHFRRHLEDL